MNVSRPIFVIGCPRSGTTVVSEIFAAHPDLAWFSNWMNRCPRLPLLAVFSRLCDLPVFGEKLRGAKRQDGDTQPLLSRFLPRPEEAWHVWERCCTAKFRSDMLTGVEPSAEEKGRTRRLVALTCRYQGKGRFLAKLTGPPRMAYLRAIFPDAYFVHVIRDGRAVVHSLLQVDFWRERGGLERPWWGGLPDESLRLWAAYGRSAEALAAVQWKYLIELARQESRSVPAGHYIEVKYEDFTRYPQETVETILRQCELPPSRHIQSYINTRVVIRDMNVKWQDQFAAHQLQALYTIMGPLLGELGYRYPEDAKRTVYS
ncbi:MAG: sulfotransferase [Thermodesulfobacteriota bacterium]|jgi:hypothetical protein